MKLLQSGMTAIRAKAMCGSLESLTLAQSYTPLPSSQRRVITGVFHRRFPLTTSSIGVNDEVFIAKVLMVVLLIGMTAVSATAQNAQPNTQPGTGDLWTSCTVAERALAVGLSSITAIIGMIIGWCIFPMTIAPLAYLTQSELAIWGSRLSMSIGAGIVGFTFPYMALVRFFAS